VSRAPHSAIRNGRLLAERANFCTATGIESRADYVTAHAIGFDVVQGYLFGKPMPLKKFARSATSRPLRLE
jgi:EAL domain-containing protein (putative c-di-GMP-specific phosphodiesterase class I)